MSLAVVLWNALTVQILHSETKLGRRVSLFRRLAIAYSRLRAIQWDTVTRGAQFAKGILLSGVALPESADLAAKALHTKV